MVEVWIFRIMEMNFREFRQIVLSVISLILPKAILVLPVS